MQVATAPRTLMAAGDSRRSLSAPELLFSKPALELEAGASLGVNRKALTRWTGAGPAPVVTGPCMVLRTLHSKPAREVAGRLRPSSKFFKPAGPAPSPSYPQPVIAGRHTCLAGLKAQVGMPRSPLRTGS